MLGLLKGLGSNAEPWMEKTIPENFPDGLSSLPESLEPASSTSGRSIVTHSPLLDLLFLKSKSHSHSKAKRMGGKGEG